MTNVQPMDVQGIDASTSDQQVDRQQGRARINVLCTVWRSSMTMLRSEIALRGRAKGVNCARIMRVLLLMDEGPPSTSAQRVPRGCTEARTPLSVASGRDRRRAHLPRRGAYADARTYSGGCAPGDSGGDSGSSSA